METNGSVDWAAIAKQLRKSKPTFSAEIPDILQYVFLWQGAQTGQ